MKIAISSGHGKYIRGASGYLDEVDEARRQVEEIAEYLRDLDDIEVTTFHDNTSHDQSTNLATITNWHNAQGPHDLDISCHFNANQTTSSPMGCEVLYVTQDRLAAEVSAAIAAAGHFKNRGGKYRGDLYVLNNTREPCILTETCFVDSSADAKLWQDNFSDVCRAIAEAVTGQSSEEQPPVSPPPARPLLHIMGRVSWFGGPNDTTGVSASEGLAFIYEYEQAPWLFLPQQPPNTTGLARRLNADQIPYVACRWDYAVTPKEMLAQPYPALVRACKTGVYNLAWPADWGPHEEQTGRAADVSPYLLNKLGIETDDSVEVIYPAPFVFMTEAIKQ